MSDAPIHLKRFLTQAEVASIRQRIETPADHFQEVSSPMGLGPRYRVIDGEHLERYAPQIVDLARGQMRHVVEKETGVAVELFGSLRRAVHVQSYSREGDGFRWHFDGHAFAAILTLENGSRGATEWMSPLLSAWLKPAIYALYPWPKLFSPLPRQAIVPDRGDLLIVSGQRCLHRGTRGSGQGERLSIVFNYDVLGRRPNRFRDWLARRINY
jgi:hypothetical protein